MATHSSILAWKIPWTKKPGGLRGPWGGKELDITEATKNILFSYLLYFACDSLK